MYVRNNDQCEMWAIGGRCGRKATARVMFHWVGTDPGSTSQWNFCPECAQKVIDEPDFDDSRAWLLVG